MFYKNETKKFTEKTKFFLRDRLIHREFCKAFSQ